MTSCMSSMRSNQLSYASATDEIIPYAEGFVKGFLKIFKNIFCAVKTISGFFKSGIDKARSPVL